MKMRIIVTNEYGKDKIQKVWNTSIQEIIQLLMKADFEYDIMTHCKCLAEAQQKISKLLKEEVDDLADRYEASVFLNIWIEEEV